MTRRQFGIFKFPVMVPIEMPTHKFHKCFSKPQNQNSVECLGSALKPWNFGGVPLAGGRGHTSRWPGAFPGLWSSYQTILESMVLGFRVVGFWSTILECLFWYLFLTLRLKEAQPSSRVYGPRSLKICVLPIRDPKLMCIRIL